jgi:hypothetical protein
MTIRGTCPNHEYLEGWMATVRGNPQAAKELWSLTEKLKAELLARQSSYPH